MKQHALCSDCEDKITPMDLPIPDGLKKSGRSLSPAANSLDAAEKC